MHVREIEIELLLLGMNVRCSDTGERGAQAAMKYCESIASKQQAQHASISLCQREQVSLHRNNGTIITNINQSFNVLVLLYVSESESGTVKTQHSSQPTQPRTA